MKPAKGKGTAKVTNEALKPADDRKVGKRKAAPAAAVEKGNKPRGRKDKKAKKDPNKPKRPPTAFFVFLEEFRKTFKKENPNANSVSAVGKAGGQKWRQMSAAEKAPYEAKAGKKKDEYGKLMNAYNNKQVRNTPESGDGHGDEEDSDKSKSEVNDDDDDEEEEDNAPVAEEAQQEKEEVVEEEEEEEEEDDDDEEEEEEEDDEDED
ncbi:High mobility group B protein 1 [Linum perenne]